ncbi:hypothetical protein OUZ56_022132 [Daphnia magna]|uniref:Uncharacterized protein n=1 Tax=Daphnia magna TaxID=35525 RepID=A0ABR0AVH0_9CRUS|nr:hypothetical protein OUZ56_022132 [Daphnia magna]
MNQQGNKNPSSAPVWPHRRKTQQTDFVQKQIDFHVVKWENVQAGLLYLNNKVNTDRLAL